jgi:hypothetical protein
MAAAPGPDLYKVDTYALEANWRALFDAMFDSAFDLYDRLGGDDPSNENYWEQVMLARCLAPFVAYKQPAGWGTLDLSSVANGRFSPAMFDGEPHKIYPQQPRALKLARIDDAIIIPAIRTLRQRQHVMLARSLSCAYVRAIPGPAGDAYAAFVGNDALTNRCRDMRNLLLDRDARQLVNLADAELIDPRMAERLRESGVSQPETGPVVGAVGLAGGNLEEEPLLASVALAKEPLKPQGGDPFGASVLPLRPSGGSGVMMLALGAAAALIAGRR